MANSYYDAELSTSPSSFYVHDPWPDYTYIYTFTSSLTGKIFEFFNSDAKRFAREMFRWEYRSSPQLTDDSSLV